MLFDNQKQTGGNKKAPGKRTRKKKHQVNALGLTLENSKVLSICIANHHVPVPFREEQQ
jgi:hypothetical protein